MTFTETNALSLGWELDDGDSNPNPCPVVKDLSRGLACPTNDGTMKMDADNASNTSMHVISALMSALDVNVWGLANV